MISNFGDIRNQVIVRSGISTTSAFFTETILNDWCTGAIRWAASYKKWPFTEGRVSTTYTTTEEWTFEGMKADSTRILQVGGKRYEKLNFEDYQIYREEEPSGTDKVFSDFGKTIFINPQAGGSGTLIAYSQFSPADVDVTDLTAKTVFSDGDEEGNEAVVEETLSYLNLRERKEDKANYHHQRAEQILNGIWDRVKDEHFNYKTHKSRGGMWKRFNVLAGGINDELTRRDQFPFG